MSDLHAETFHRHKSLAHVREKLSDVITAFDPARERRFDAAPRMPFLCAARLTGIVRGAYPRATTKAATNKSNIARFRLLVTGRSQFTRLDKKRAPEA